MFEMLLLQLDMPLVVLVGVLESILVFLQRLRPPPLSRLVRRLILGLLRRARLVALDRRLVGYLQFKLVFIFKVPGATRLYADVHDSPEPLCGPTASGGPRLVSLKSTSKATAIFSS